MNDTKPTAPSPLAGATGSAAPTDTERLDWLQRIMTPGKGYVEVYLSGLRFGQADAIGFQFESNPQYPHWSLVCGPSLRDAIDTSMRKQLNAPDELPAR